MPTYNDVEVWLEDAGNQKLNYQEVVINPVDERFMLTVKTEMVRDELYTVHCLSPVSVFCDVFVISAHLIRKRAARFYLDTSMLAPSEHAWGSSIGHVEGQFRERGIRTSKRQYQQSGQLGGLEVEVRRIGEIVKAEHAGKCGVSASEEVITEFTMVDDFDQAPWLLFHFDINLKDALATPSPSRNHLAKRWRNADETPTKVYPPTRSNPNQLQREYQEEEAEEQRLLRKLQDQLKVKKARNSELRRLLGET